MTATRDDLEARGIRVKALEWVRHPTAEIWRSDTMLGTYKVFGIGPFPTWDFDSAPDAKDATSKRAETHEAAKAAAQADYEARILAALEATPEALSAHPAVRALIREAEEKEQSFWVGLANKLVDQIEKLQAEVAAIRKRGNAMTELTDEAVKALLDRLRSETEVASRTEAADMIEALYAERDRLRADADAAVALVVERAVRGVSDLTHWTGDDDHGTTLVALQEAITAIRALASPSGVDALAALRAERDAALAEVTRFREDRTYVIGANDGWDAAVEQGEASPAVGNAMVRFWKRLAETHNSRAATAEADRDRLAAANAALEAQVARAKKAAQDYCWQRYSGREPMNLSSPAVFTSHEWQKIGEAIDAALAEVQADARREGGGE